MKAKEFIRRIKKHGVEIVKGRGKGGHVQANFQGRSATIPVHGAKDVDPVFLKAVCKQLGIDPDDIV
jgi:predicted RNA binding protein YcfA (HicA-like mRNA interferase family)